MNLKPILDTAGWLFQTETWAFQSPRNAIAVLEDLKERADPFKHTFVWSFSTFSRKPIRVNIKGQRIVLMKKPDLFRGIFGLGPGEFVGEIHQTDSGCIINGNFRLSKFFSFFINTYFICIYIVFIISICALAFGVYQFFAQEIDREMFLVRLALLGMGVILFIVGSALVWFFRLGGLTNRRAVYQFLKTLTE